jgi:thymidylate kinase
MIIVFSGIDCAGKSTQINLLKNKITDQGIIVSCIWSRGGYTPGFEFIKKILRSILGKKSIPSGKGGKRDKVMSNTLVSNLWLMVAMFDLLILYAVIIRVNSFLGNVVICDRYLGDTFIDFSLNFPSSNFEKMWLWKLLVTISPKPDIGFLFTLPVEESIYRSKLKNEPFPDSKEVLVRRLEIYTASKLFNDSNWVKIDGFNTISATAGIIKDKALPILRRTNAS